MKIDEEVSTKEIQPKNKNIDKVQVWIKKETLAYEKELSKVYFMGKEHSESMQIRNAFEILDSVSGSLQTIKTRKKLTEKLAVCLWKEAKKCRTRKGKKQQKFLSKMLKDVNGKAFFTAFADQCFRTKNLKRTADQINYLIHQLSYEYANL